MENISDKVRRWGIWSVAQINAENQNGEEPNKKINIYCPINANSRYVNGYQVMFGLVRNPQFQPDYKNNILRVNYQHLVGKVGLDSDAGMVSGSEISRQCFC